MTVSNSKFRQGVGWRDVTPAHSLYFIYNLKIKVIQMGTMVIQMHTNGILKVAYEKLSILHMGWACEMYIILEVI